MQVDFSAATDGKAVAKVVKQRSLSRTESYQGVAIHSGRDVTVRLLPAPAKHGIVFVRSDLPGQPRVPASAAFAQGEARHTAICHGAAQVATPEHLLAA